MRPWTKLIAKYSDIVLYATFNPESTDWEIQADYRGSLTDPVDINNAVQAKIDALPASVANQIATLNTMQDIDPIAERADYYSNNPKRGLEIESVPADGKIHSVLPL